MRKRHKKRIIVWSIVILFFAALWAYYFPVQRFYCEKKYYQYIAAQGIDASEITSIRFYKDVTQDGYYVDVEYKSDPAFRYEYHYYLVTRTRNDGLKFDQMSLMGFDQGNCSVPDVALKYPPIAS